MRTVHIQHAHAYMNWKQNLSGNCWRQPSDKCRKLVLQPTYFALVTAILKDKQSSTDTIRPFVLSPPIKNKQYHAPDELVHAALKAKVTSHYDLRVKVSLHTLPAWLTFPASLSTVCRGHTPAGKKPPHWIKPNDDDPCDAETHADNRSRGLFLSFVLWAPYFLTKQTLGCMGLLWPLPFIEHHMLLRSEKLTISPSLFVHHCRSKGGKIMMLRSVCSPVNLNMYLQTFYNHMDAGIMCSYFTL